jgi:protein ImuB
VLWCPHWPVVATGAAAGEPVVVLQANTVIAHSRAAGADGVAVGQRRRQAQGRCPQVRIVAHDPVGEARVFDAVVQVVGGLIPRVEITEPGTLTFVARGPSRYFGGDAAMAERMTAVATAALAAGAGAAGLGSLQAVGGFGMGVADGRFAAAIAARRAVRLGAAVVVPPGVEATAAFLSPLPIRLLSLVGGLDPAFVHLLGRLGVHRLGDVAALPEHDVLARFGRPGAFARAIAAGGDERLPGTQDPPPGLRVERVFEQSVHQTDVLVFVGRQLSEELAGGLAAGGQVCTRLAVTAETDHGEHSERVWYRPTGLSAAAMVERVRWQLDAWVQHDAITAGVTLLRLEPLELRRDDGVQLGLWGGRTQADEWATRAVARLVAVAGEQQVLVPAAGGGRQPGDAYTWVPALTADLAEPQQRLAVGAGPWPGRLPSPAPALVHARPVGIVVLAADGSDVHVSGRGVVSSAPATVRLEAACEEELVAWAGPWPLEERWWDAARSRRAARFQLLTGSGRLLLAVVERQQWYLAAEYA